MQIAEIKQLPEQPSAPIDNEAVAYERRFLDIPLASLIPAELALVINVSPVLPKQTLLGSLRDGRLRVKIPIRIKFAKEDKYIIAEAVELNEFGFGANLSEAIHDLQRAIVELYLTLEQDQHRLGPDLQQVWAALQRTIQRKP
jgi:hypothetical protein